MQIWRTISMTRQYPIVNRFVQLPDNLERNRSAVSVAAFQAVVPNSTVVKLLGETGGVGSAGARDGVQEFIRMPAVINNAYSSTMENAKSTLATTNAGITFTRDPEGDGSW